MVYNCYVLSALRYNCILQLNLTRTQKKELASLGTRARKILNFDVAPIENELYILVRKCIKENVCSNFLEYFKINLHNKMTRNKDLLPRLEVLDWSVTELEDIDRQTRNVLQKHRIRKTKIYIKIKFTFSDILMLISSQAFSTFAIEFESIEYNPLVELCHLHSQDDRIFILF